MANQHLARIEAQLERVIEGAFAQLFRHRVSAHDILLEVSRAFEENVEQPERDDPRPIAPDRFTIYLHPDIRQRFLEHQPQFIALLIEHLTELNASLDMRMINLPTIEIAADPDLSLTQIVVKAEHNQRSKLATASLERVNVKATDRIVRNPQLIIDGHDPVVLEADVLNLGRSRDNDIMLNDPYVSRHHAQLRLRFGTYTLFDNDSQGGVFINDVRVREHRLQPGDVILMGRTRMLYIEDTESSGNSQTDVYPLQQH
ncbi:MAG: DUF3662 domain-containing protein [Anaerolineae bacterium]|nr:DUF3662 domain-containing protein [Anaerolineae bacterium]MCA9908825.1 DUF3662 domain-containing protein [Anaerolineae bacterium]